MLIIRNLKPGGWAEFSDYDINFKSDDGTLEGTDLQRWIIDILSSCEAMGCEPSPGRRLKQWMLDAGFKDVVEHVFVIPTGEWATSQKHVSLFLFFRYPFLPASKAFISYPPHSLSISH